MLAEVRLLPARWYGCRAFSCHLSMLSDYIPIKLSFHMETTRHPKATKNIGWMNDTMEWLCGRLSEKKRLIRFLVQGTETGQGLLWWKALIVDFFNVLVFVDNCFKCWRLVRWLDAKLSSHVVFIHDFICGPCVVDEYSITTIMLLFICFAGNSIKWYVLVEFVKYEVSKWGMYWYFGELQHTLHFFQVANYKMQTG